MRELEEVAEREGAQRAVVPQVAQEEEVPQVVRVRLDVSAVTTAQATVQVPHLPHIQL